jgi:hypothetical protein
MVGTGFISSGYGPVAGGRALEIMENKFQHRICYCNDFVAQVPQSLSYYSSI